MPLARRPPSAAAGIRTSRVRPAGSSRPSSVRLSATGRSIPWPTLRSRAAGVPAAWIASRTARARLSLSVLFAAGWPTLSVWPSTLNFSAGWARIRAAFSSIVALALAGTSHLPVSELTYSVAKPSFSIASSSAFAVTTCAASSEATTTLYVSQRPPTTAESLPTRTQTSRPSTVTLATTRSPSVVRAGSSSSFAPGSLLSAFA